MATVQLCRGLSAKAALARSISSRGQGKGREFSALLSPAEEYPDLPFLSSTPSKASTSASVTTLPSGLKVVTESASTTTTVSLTYPNAGSFSENISEGGASLANQCLSFKSGSGLSSLVILRNLEDDGATPFTFAGRDGAGMGFTAAPDKAERLVPLLATNCSFEKWDVRDAIALAGEKVDAAQSCAQTVLTDLLYAAAYGGQSSFGRSFHTKGATGPSIISFRERTYSANGAVLSATGISDHDTFCKVVQEGFAQAKSSGEEPSSSASTYIGGECRLSASSGGYAHIALALEGPTANNASLLNVVKHSLNLSCPAESNISAFAASGLVGVYTAVPAANAAAATDALCEALQTNLSSDVVERAIQKAKAEALFGLEDGSRSLAQAMTSSVLSSGSFSWAETAASYDELTPGNVASALKSKKLSLAAVGDIHAVPYHATLSARFS